MTAITQPLVPTHTADEPDDRRRGRLATLLFGSVDQATWIRPAFLAVVGLAAVLYMWDLAISGWANTYYAMAAQAASQSWAAWFFGSLDASNFITIDKPPLSTMLMGLSVRLFGLSSWSILLPQALAGVATVVVLYAAVRRSFGPAAATIAAVAMALTPVSVLIFRYDNPDALLTLLLVGAAAALFRSLETDRLRWVVLAASLVGLGFLTKYLQAYLVLPAFALTYLVAAPGGLVHRARGLAVAFVTVIVTSGWWVAAVELIPTADRPFIGGSTTDSALELLLGYDGLGRIFGGSGAGPAGAAIAGGGGGGIGANFSGEAGLLRLFNAEFGGQISWLLPFALIALVAGLWLRRRAGRTDLGLAGYVLWGSWLLVTALVFSFMSGIVHTYYAVALAPAVAALVGAGTVDLWRLRARSMWGGVVLGGAILASAVWAWALLARTPDFAPGLGTVVLLVGGAAALLIALPTHVVKGRFAMAVVAVAFVALLAGPTAFAYDTMGQALSGGDPSAGPTVPGSEGFGQAAGGRARPDGGQDGMPAGQAPGQVPGLGEAPTGGTPPDGGGGFTGGPGGPGAGGDATVSQDVLDYLVANQGDADWIVAVSGSGSAAPIQLATGLPVMTMGGFNGDDASPTVAELQAYVASGQLRYAIVGGGGGGMPGGRGTSDVTAWITANGTAITVGGTTIYDLAPTD